MELIWRKCATCDGERVVKHDNEVGVGVCGACHGNGAVAVMDSVALTLLLRAMTYYMHESEDHISPEHAVLSNQLRERLVVERHEFRKIGQLDDFGRVYGNDSEYIDDEAKRKYGDKIGGQVVRRLYEAIKEIGDSCVDNHRVCELGDPIDMVVYHRDKISGCCGSHDEIYTDEETGRRFMVGFNYGH